MLYCVKKKSLKEFYRNKCSLKQDNHKSLLLEREVETSIPSKADNVLGSPFLILSNSVRRVSLKDEKKQNVCNANE